MECLDRLSRVSLRQSYDERTRNDGARRKVDAFAHEIGAKSARLALDALDDGHRIVHVLRRHALGRRKRRVRRDNGIGVVVHDGQQRFGAPHID